MRTVDCDFRARNMSYIVHFSWISRKTRFKVPIVIFRSSDCVANGSSVIIDLKVNNDFNKYLKKSAETKTVTVTHIKTALVAMVQRHLLQSRLDPSGSQSFVSSHPARLLRDGSHLFVKDEHIMFTFQTNSNHTFNIRNNGLSPTFPEIRPPT
jgi:hypothetical protein